MSAKPKPIEDYYGAELEVEVVGHSAGYMVDLDWRHLDGHGLDEASGFFSLTGEDAFKLGERLIAASKEAS